MYVNRSFSANCGSKRQAFTLGEEVSEKDLPSGMVQSLVRTGVLSHEAPVVPEEPTSEPDWRDTPLAGAGLSANLLKALQSAGAETVRDALQLADDNEGDLTKLDGIGDSGAKEFQEAAKKLQPADK